MMDMVGGGGDSVKCQGSKAKQGSDTMDRAVGWNSEGLEFLPVMGSEANYSLLNTQIFSLQKKDNSACLHMLLRVHIKIIFKYKVLC